ncbi:MAG: hypothetical protein DI565_12835 [Ancylobacter novellus]|uniref:Uncharacterized protein n=1 Tax=Ancylobacter novellus TaxID=921 RepID=A0A2W5KE45_ANCNO|nr:MAG: hypothetical protein DI565_12835 [Ancylobacter novellus]
MDNAQTAALYAALTAAKEARPTAVRDLPKAERQTYQAEASKARRARRKAEREGGDLKPTPANIYAVLADISLMVLATGGPGADALKSGLAAAFGLPGLPMSVEARARSGDLAPKLVTAARLRARAKAVAGN